MNYKKFQKSYEVFESSCPYLENKICKSVVFSFEEEAMFDVYSDLISQGFRRIYNLFYKNACLKCEECIPLRVKVKDFKPNKSFKRIIKKNNDIKVELKKIEDCREEKLSLFLSYLSKIHGRNGFNLFILDEFISIHRGYSNIIEMHYYSNDRLIGVGIVDETRDALSSVYFYYEPEERKRSPGIFSIIKEIELAKELGKDYLYLGFYIKNCKKMNYKNRFKPYEILVAGKWEEG